MSDEIDRWKVMARETALKALRAYKSHPNFQEVEKLAADRGYRLADAFEGVNNAPKDLFSFAGGVWVKNSAHDERR